MPAGHSCPPHSETLVWSCNGGERRPEKGRVMIVDEGRGEEGARSSEIVRKGLFSVEGGEAESNGSISCGKRVFVRMCAGVEGENR